jgi:hypothetical protein
MLIVEIFPFFIFGAFFILVIVLGVYSYFQSKQRRLDLSQWAAAHGLSFSEEKDGGFDDRFPNFSCLKQGSSRYAYNIMQGRIEENGILAFDYHYETQSTDSDGKTTTYNHYFSAVIVDSGLPLKQIFIRGENFFDKIGGFLGMTDIELESAEFNRQFHVAAPDRRWAFDFLSQESMEFLLNSPRFSLDIHDGLIIAYNNTTFSVQNFDEAIGVAAGLIKRLSPSVVKELKESKA